MNLEYTIPSTWQSVVIVVPSQVGTGVGVGVGLGVGFGVGLGVGEGVVFGMDTVVVVCVVSAVACCFSWVAELLEQPHEKIKVKISAVLQIRDKKWFV